MAIIVGTQRTNQPSNYCRALDLWNGSSNNSPPTNWFDTGFDDSGWALSNTPQVSWASQFIPYISTSFNNGFAWIMGSAYNTPNHNNPGTGFYNTYLYPLPQGSTAATPDASYFALPVGPSAAFESATQQFLVRWHFTLPNFTVDPTDFALYAWHNAQTSEGISSWINGTFISFSGALAGALLPGQSNVLAWWQNQPPGSAIIDSTRAANGFWVALMLHFPDAQPRRGRSFAQIIG